MNEVYLRPLTVGELLDKAFRIYRSKFPTLIGIVAAVLIPESLIRVFAIFYLGGNAGSLISSFSQSFLRLFASLALVMFISHAYLKKPITFGDAFSGGLKRYWSVWGANFMMGLAIGVPIGIVVGCATVTVGGGYLLIIPALPVVFILSMRWSLLMPAIVLENIGASEGLRRSWNLTKDYFWRVLGTSFAASLLTLLITLLPTYFATYLFSLMDISNNVVQLTTLFIEQVALLISLPFSQAVIVLIYYDLRVRKEGFDLQVLAGVSNAPIVVPD